MLATLAVGVAIRAALRSGFLLLSLLQPVFYASSLLPSAAAPRQTVISALTWVLSVQAVGCLLIVNNNCECSLPPRAKTNNAGGLHQMSVR